MFLDGLVSLLLNGLFSCLLDGLFEMDPTGLFSWLLVGSFHGPQTPSTFLSTASLHAGLMFSVDIVVDGQPPCWTFV